MNKEKIGFFLIIVALFFGALYKTGIIEEPIRSTLNDIKITYKTNLTNISNFFDKYFFQAQTIQELKQQQLKYENNHLVMQQLASEVTNLFELNKSKLKSNPKVELTRVIGYEEFGDLNRLWIDVPDYNSSKIYGLTYKELVAGIVIPKGGRALALLNRDIKCTYSVYIGNSKAPGVAHGNNDENIVVEYIPAWFNIDVGDEVITSGLDNIFFKNLKVGVVLSITKSQGYQNVVVKPYYDSSNPDYFYIIKKTR